MSERRVRQLILWMLGPPAGQPLRETPVLPYAPAAAQRWPVWTRAREDSWRVLQRPGDCIGVLGPLHPLSLEPPFCQPTLLPVPRGSLPTPVSSECPVCALCLPRLAHSLKPSYLHLQMQASRIPSADNSPLFISGAAVTGKTPASGPSLPRWSSAVNTPGLGTWKTRKVKSVHICWVFPPI